MKRSHFLAIPMLSLLLITCKKDNTANNSTDPIGTWTLYSWSDPGQSLNVTADQYPCMADNIITINSDHTYTVKYTGNDSCFVAKYPSPGPGQQSGTTIGIPGQPSSGGNWSLNGNYLTLGKYHCIISNANGKLTLTETDTLTYNNGTKDIITTVDIKKQ